MERRYDIDWLRVLAFGLLIFYHTGMFFVPWGWHIKNPVTYEWLEYPMLFVNRWRMPLLFLISGMGTWFSLRKRGAGNYAKERIKMLLNPLWFGMLVVVPPQIYAERIVKDQFTGSYFDFWPAHLFDNGAYPAGNISWHHLWFLPYLLLFSLALLPLFDWFKKHPENRFSNWLAKRAANPIGIYLFILPLVVCEVFLDPFFPVTHALTDDWFYLPYCAVFFLSGFLLISVQQSFWPMIKRYAFHFVVSGIIAYTLFLYIRANYEDGWQRHIIEAFVNHISIWSWLLAWFGLAARYLNRKSELIIKANRAVYPFYILHQTVIILLAWWVMDADWGLFLKFSFISLGCFLICWGLYVGLIERFRITRFFFGVRQLK